MSRNGTKLPAVISCIEEQSAGPMQTLDPFLFCVYHKDQYPAGNAKMEAPRRGDGADFNPAASYRMYHGERVPGFPAHPHRGFETVTATMQGVIDHADSKGNSGRYGGGDLQWMTAGSGVQHSEMFPLVNMKQDQKDNTCRFFQIWLNLPAAGKFSSPAFAMHWNEEIPRVKSADGKTSITVWAGSALGEHALPPPPDSWAADPSSDVAIWLIEMEPGATYTIPAAESAATNRALYYVEGDALVVGGMQLQRKGKLQVILRAELEAELRNPGESKVEVLLLQGKPIGEPVAQHGPFVMNTQKEIEEAFSDYRRTQFGGWPWASDSPVFPRTKGRFAHFEGVETTPPAPEPL